MVDILLNIFDLFSKTFFLFYSYEIDKSNQNIQSNTNSNRWFYYIEHYFYINTFPNNFFQMFLRDILILLSHNKIKFFLINSYKPWSHNRPVTPIPQRQIPVRASHVAPLRQSHRWIHPGPYQPRSQAKEKNRTKSSLNRRKRINDKHRSQYRPTWPEWHKQRPVNGSHWALFIHRHFCRQSGGP
jgi:hypothetical protein